MTRKLIFLHGAETDFLESNFMALIMLGKLLSSLSDRNFGASCFNEHMIEKYCENKGQF